MGDPGETLLDVQDLKKYYFRDRFLSRDLEPVRAVDGVSFRLRKGETLGLVGESGCGKTTVGKSILRLIEPTSGHVFFDGRDLLGLARESMRRLRPRMQFVFQDPYESLNPRLKVLDIVGEGLEVHGRVTTEKGKREKVSEILDRVGLHVQDRDRYPHEFSGGQRQRIGIARAISLDPEFIVADEPVSALDVSIQAQILNLLMDLRDQLGLTYLFISHDLRVVRHLSHRIAVMYMGRIVEQARAEDLFARPLHPYTRLLLSAIPSLDTGRKRERSRAEDGGSPAPAPTGCTFLARCPHGTERCRSEAPLLVEQEEEHFVACHVSP
jgi:oligopeptide/dipeptide ABC transporter ATP-binding protein